MIIKVAGQEYRVTNTKRKSRSLGSLTDLTVENNASNDKAVAAPNNNNVGGEQCDDTCGQPNAPDAEPPQPAADVSRISKASDGLNKNYCLNKSKSECNPFDHKRKGKIIRLTERPKTHGNLLFSVGMHAARSPLVRMLHAPPPRVLWHTSNHAYFASFSHRSSIFIINYYWHVPFMFFL